MRYVTLCSALLCAIELIRPAMVQDSSKAVHDAISTGICAVLFSAALGCVWHDVEDLALCRILLPHVGNSAMSCTDKSEHMQ